jgi:hypothetical protein
MELNRESSSSRRQLSGWQSKGVAVGAELVTRELVEVKSVVVDTEIDDDPLLLLEDDEILELESEVVDAETDKVELVLDDEDELELVSEEVAGGVDVDSLEVIEDVLELESEVVDGDETLEVSEEELELESEGDETLEVSEEELELEFEVVEAAADVGELPVEAVKEDRQEQAELTWEGDSWQLSK